MTDVIGHFDTLEKYYRDAKIPRISTKKGNVCSDVSVMFV